MCSAAFAGSPLLVGVAQVIDTVQVSQVADLQIWVKKVGFLTCRSCLAASAPALELNVTNPTGLAVFPFFEVTFSKEPS